jgi:Tol biopolymer transport system component
MWTIVRMNCETGELNSVRDFQNCTPDWFGDSKHLIFSSRPAKQTGLKGYGWTQLWMADAEGKGHKLVYGEDGFHIYSGALSPDGNYVLFSKCPVDGGGSEKEGAPICIVRLADTPMIAGKSTELRKVHPDTKDGPVLAFGNGWEPHWTYAEIGEK